jgi:N-acetyl-alpha-D-muramate 1-phosphate uridylyltransferase
MYKKSEKIKQAVILAGGLATRLHPITQKIPKAMVSIKGRPFFEYELELCKKNGIQEIVLCVGHLSDQIKKHFGNGKKFGVNIIYSDEKKKLDTGGALKKAFPYLDKEFLVTYGDSYLDIDWQEAYRFYKKSKAKGLMTVFKNNRKIVPSTTLIDKKGYVLEFDKENPRPEMCYMEYGINIFCKDVAKKVPKEVFPLGDYFNLLAKDKQLISLETEVMFYDMGTPEGIEKLSKII